MRAAGVRARVAGEEDRSRSFAVAERDTTGVVGVFVFLLAKCN